MSLKDKLKELHGDSEHHKIDWKQNKENWIKSVYDLFTTIEEEWIDELLDEGLLTVKNLPISINEENIGTYLINKIEIIYPNGSIVLEPVGADIIGGEGRIDFYLKGEFGKGLMLILFHENDKDNWFLINKQQGYEQELLSKESFEKIIEQWIAK